MINDKNYEEIKKDLELIIKIGGQFGEDIIRLFADLYLIYEMKDKEDENPSTKMIEELSITMGAKINLGRTQASLILDKINYKSQQKNCEIKGEDYCFIAIMLQELFIVYTSLMTFLYTKRYLHEKDTDAFNERIRFLISPPYEGLRQKFKVIECFTVAEPDHSFILPTVH